MPFLGAAVKPVSQGSPHACALSRTRLHTHLAVWPRDTNYSVYANYCANASGRLFTFSARQVPGSGCAPPCTRQRLPSPHLPLRPLHPPPGATGARLLLQPLQAAPPSPGLSCKSLTRGKSWVGRWIAITVHVLAGLRPRAILIWLVWG